MNWLKQILLGCFLGCSLLGISQNVDVPQRSPRLTTTLRVGLTYVTIDYSSPSANNQPKFGSAIPYGAMWGAGDRENTTIEFTNDVLIEGKEIKAGKYGVFMVPSEDNFQILFSKYYRSWSDTYPLQDEIVATVNAIPKKNSFTEWLSYHFIERTTEYCTVVLDWENVRVPFKIEVVNPNEVLFESLKAELKGRGKYLWGAYSDAAANLNFRNIYMDTALEWINSSLELERNGINLQVKASILLKSNGDVQEIKKILYEAVPLAKNPWVLNSIVYNLLEVGDTKKAIEAAQKLTRDHKDHNNIWAFTDTLAETYLKDGNKDMAIKYYRIAQSEAPKNQQEYYENLISNLEK